MLGILEYLLCVLIIPSLIDDARIGADDAPDQLLKEVTGLHGRGLGEHGWVRIHVEDGLEGLEEQGEALGLPGGAWGVIEGGLADLGGHAGDLMVWVVNVVDTVDVQTVLANLRVFVGLVKVMDESE